MFLSIVTKDWTGFSDLKATPQPKDQRPKTTDQPTSSPTNLVNSIGIEVENENENVQRNFKHQKAEETNNTTYQLPPKTTDHRPQTIKDPSKKTSPISTELAISKHLKINIC